MKTRKGSSRAEKPSNDEEDASSDESVNIIGLLYLLIRLRATLSCSQCSIRVRIQCVDVCINCFVN